MPTLTGYGPKRDNESRWNRLLFDGDEENYEIWETKFLGYLRSFSLKDAIFGANLIGDYVGNEEACAELV